MYQMANGSMGEQSESSRPRLGLNDACQAIKHHSLVSNGDQIMQIKED